MSKPDIRPIDCRFRLQDEGKGYPRSSCSACGRTITTGLGRRCYLETEALEKLAARPALPEGVEMISVFLKGAAKYFEKRPTDGEDLAHWANVFNAENCLKAADALETKAAEIACRDALIKDHLRKILHLENRIEEEHYRAEKAEAEIARLTDAIATLRELRDYDGKLIASQKYELSRRDEALRIAEEALSETVAAYGNQGGPWNVPSNPGGWLSRARAALETIRNEIK